jgi:hypothetical protein
MQSSRARNKLRNRERGMALLIALLALLLVSAIGMGMMYMPTTVIPSKHSLPCAQGSKKRATASEPMHHPR